MRTGLFPQFACLVAFLTVVVCGACSESAWAQTISFQHLSVDDGLSEDKINALLQDARGFIWVGTLDGLDRFDGYTVTEFRNAADDTTTISANGVISLLEDLDGYIWVGTSDGGLNRFDPATEAFTHFRHDPDDPDSLPNDDVLALVQADDGTIWIGTDDGLCRLDEDTGAFTTYQHAEGNASSLSHDRVLALHIDTNGTLWVGTDGGGLNRFDGEFESFTSFQVVDDPPGNFVSAIAPRERGGFWIGTFGGGVRTFDSVSAAFQSIDLEGGIGSTIITSLYEDTDGSLWIGTAGGGLHKLDADNRQYSYRRDENRSDALSHNFVRTIMSDRQGVLWIGTYGGLNWFDRARKSFRIYTHERGREQSLSSNTVLSVTQTSDSTVWVGTDEGLNRLIDANGTFERFMPPEALGGGQQFITTLYESRAGQFWVGTRQGLLEFNRVRGSFRSVLLNGHVVSAIHEDSTGQLWVGSLDTGLVHYNPATGASEEISHDPERSSSLSHQTVQFVEESSDGIIWIGTAGGLDRLVDEDNGGVFDHFRHDPSDSTSISDSSIMALHARINGELWIGTEAGGLNKFIPNNPGEGFKAYTETSSDLPGNAVRAIVEDESGFLWLSTSRGLARFDPVTETFRVFDSERTPGLRSLTDAAFSSPSGSLFFGGADGLIAFDPSQISTSNPYPPQVALTSVRILEEKVVHGEDAPLREAAPVADVIYLDHDHTVVTFEFAALHFSDPDRNRYAVMLDGFEDEWRDLGLERRAVYTGLDPGRYTLRVKAASADGVWSEEPLAVRIHVAPPWWRTIWAYLLYALLFVGLVVVADRFQRERLLRQERVRAEHREAELRAEMAEIEAKVLKVENERKAAELEQAHELEKAYTALEESHQHLKTTQTQLIQAEKLASLGQLTAGIAHEIKNPLNFVTNFAELSVDLADELNEELSADPSRPVGEVLPEVSDLIEDLKENARRIHDHGQRAGKIVHAMLQHSRGGAGEASAVNINEFVEEYINLAFHGQRARDVEFDVEMKLDFDQEAGEVELIPQDIGRVLINLLGNAFYAVQEESKKRGEGFRPTVFVSTKRCARTVEIRIADNGPGIPEDIRRKIFEPFFTTKPSGEGTGLGLSLSYEIVTQGHGGALSLESSEGEGATFIVELPI